MEEEMARVKTIRARFSEGIIKPLEKLEIEEGKEIIVTIKEKPFRVREDAFERSAGRWKGTIDAEALIENIYADRLIRQRSEIKL
jgi:predicted DNA-binding antitoxin AbrB/MazE fold protein